MIGPQICTIHTKEKNINMKYVPFNHASIQQIKKDNPKDQKHYILMIDSSGNIS